MKDDKKNRDATIQKIAATILDLETLETRRSGDLDFHELGVWNIKNALIAAYEAGKQAGN